MWLSIEREVAVVSITIDEEFVVHDIKVIEGDKGLFIAMPSKKATDGEYRDIAHPINSSTRENLQRVILESYEKALEEPEEAKKDIGYLPEQPPLYMDMTVIEYLRLAAELK